MAVDPFGFARTPSRTVTTRQLPAHAAYQSAVRPSSVSSTRAPAFNKASATDASLYEVVINGVLAAAVPIGRSFGFAPAFTSRSTIELERADRSGGKRLFGGPSGSLPSSINLRAIETSSRSIA